MTWAIDVSLYDSRRWVFGQGWVYDRPIDWVKARYDGGLSLAIIKSSEGTWPDPAFKLNWKAAKGILPRMAYHFFRSNVDPIAQADYVHFLMVTNDYDNNRDFVILDLETMDKQPANVVLGRARIFLERLTKYGYAPLIYTYPAFWRGIGGETALWAKQYPLGIAQWPLDNYIAGLPVNLFDVQGLADLKHKIEAGTLRPMALKPWDQCALWQFTSRVDARAVPGHPAIKKAVDYNKVYMHLAGLPVIAPPPAAPPEPLKLYRCTALLLKVFAGAGDQYKLVTRLSSGQVVKVLGYATSLGGEMFAHIEMPAGWVRANWLEKV
jgi:GH25 family lysozyme M1 (1,4-beta-N-acetylmuramidase)